MNGNGQSHVKASAEILFVFCRVRFMLIPGLFLVGVFLDSVAQPAVVHPCSLVDRPTLAEMSDSRCLPRQLR